MISQSGQSTIVVGVMDGVAVFVGVGDGDAGIDCVIDTVGVLVGV